jgi:hypothetical protein
LDTPHTGLSILHPRMSLAKPAPPREVLPHRRSPTLRRRLRRWPRIHRIRGRGHLAFEGCTVLASSARGTSRPGRGPRDAGAGLYASAAGPFVHRRRPFSPILSLMFFGYPRLGAAVRDGARGVKTSRWRSTTTPSRSFDVDQTRIP